MKTVHKMLLITTLCSAPCSVFAAASSSSSGSFDINQFMRDSIQEIDMLKKHPYLKKVRLKVNALAVERKMDEAKKWADVFFDRLKGFKAQSAQLELITELDKAIKQHEDEYGQKMHYKRHSIFQDADLKELYLLWKEQVRAAQSAESVELKIKHLEDAQTTADLLIDSLMPASSLSNLERRERGLVN